MDPASLVDLDRYPIDRLESARGAAMVAAAAADLERDALALLPGFLRPEAITAMVDEATPLVPRAHRRDRLRTPYGWMDNSGFAKGHPRRALHRHCGGAITRDMMAPQGPAATLFDWPVLTEFVRRVLGFETLHCSADPYLSLEIHIEDEGDQFAWHFDTNDGVVSLLLQAADNGGAFEYAPYVRDEDDENYEEIARIFEGTSQRVRRPEMSAGTFVLFRGRRSIHRVSPVGATARPRLIALFSYDRKPGMVFPENTVRAAMDPSDAPHLGTPAP